MPTFDELFLDSAAVSFDKQLVLASVVGDSAWRFDLAAGTLTFENAGPLVANVDILGTESMQTNAWLWSWASEASQIPPHLMQTANGLRRHGAQHAIPELTEPHLPLGPIINGHALAIVACHAAGADAYYRVPYEGGAMYVLVFQPTLRQPVNDPLMRVAMNFPRLLMSFPISNAKRALIAHIAHYGLAGEERDEGKVIAIRDARGGELKAHFDTNGRLTELKRG